MNAPDTLALLQGMGLTLTAKGGQLVVTPKERITDQARSLIRENKAALLERLQDGPLTPDEKHELRSLVRWMAHHWRFSPQELAEAMSAAAEDPASALQSYRATVKRIPPDDRVFCDTNCRRCINGRCEYLRAALGPEWTQPRRCEGFAPFPNDPDQRDGLQRWPSLVESHAQQDTTNGHRRRH